MSVNEKRAIKLVYLLVTQNIQNGLPEGTQWKWCSAGYQFWVLIYFLYTNSGSKLILFVIWKLIVLFIFTRWIDNPACEDTALSTRRYYFGNNIILCFQTSRLPLYPARLATSRYRNSIRNSWSIIERMHGVLSH